MYFQISRVPLFMMLSIQSCGTCLKPLILGLQLCSNYISAILWQKYKLPKCRNSWADFSHNINATRWRLYTSHLRFIFLCLWRPNFVTLVNHKFICKIYYIKTQVFLTIWLFPACLLSQIKIIAIKKIFFTYNTYCSLILLKYIFKIFEELVTLLNNRVQHYQESFNFLRFLSNY